LRRQLGELAANPSSVSELIETGRTALRVGDGEAALGFFTRASQLAPEDARVKAGLAAANARTGRPQTALLLFSEALAAGASEADIAAERGLAFDLIGQSARAQQDYLTSLKQREDPEVRRRLALSLAISGQREAALRLLDPQVRTGDRAGSRARVMVIALSGDVRGATAAASASLPPGSAQAIAPFLTRLASLEPGQMAAAVNLGRLPSVGVRSVAPRNSPAADPNALAFAGGGNVAALSSRLPVAPPASDAARRRPGAVNSAARSPGRTDTSRTLASSRLPITAAPAPNSPSSSSLTAPVTNTAATAVAAASAVPTSVAMRPVAQAAFLQPHPYEPLRLTQPKPSEGQPAGAAAAEQPVELAGATSGPRVPQAELKTEEPVLTGATASQPVHLAQTQLSATPAAAVPQQEPQPRPADGAALNLAVWTGSAAAASPAPAATVAPAGTREPARLASTRPGFADVVAVVTSLPVESSSEKPAAPFEPAPARIESSETRNATATRTTRAASRNNATIRTTEAAAGPATPARTFAAAHPSRIWVQLAAAPSPAAFGYEMRRMQRAAPDLFKDRSAHVAPIGSGHRLLVGPFENWAAARTFINELKQKDIDALSWTSPAGTAVERLAADK
jgi:Flp pilus assembly protein TadD